jgi:peptide/nickel transport system permease protein
MQRYILARIFQGILTTLAVVSIVFLLTRLSGDPLGWLVSINTTAEVRQKIASNYGLDKPVIVQYQKYLVNMFQGEFGNSFRYKKTVMEVIAERVPATAELLIVSLFISLIGIPIGVYSAVGKGKFSDIAGRGFAFVGMSAPSFLVGMILILVFAVYAGILPVGGRYSAGSVILPAVTLAFTLMAGVARITRSELLEVLGADYLIFARSKGVSERMIIWKHAFKNASIPIITYIMFLLIMFISGDVVVENVFAWPGLGRLTIQAVISRDYPLVQAITLVTVFLFIISSLIADVIYVYLNPKVRFRQEM